ncbi:MAG: ABC transporter permease [Spirochaetales bacterium]|nr:ABC transporter permease [Spirochaetales bacterium]MBR0521525.1 ABC transporter permease [Spirochaetales bacterium]
MRKYIWKRIFFSVLSLLAVTWIVMLLVFSLTDRSAIFQTDDVWNKRSNNDRVLYEYTQYQRYGYLEFVNFTAFSKAKWAGVYGDSFDSSKEYTDDRNVIQKVGDDYLKNQTVQEFIQYYESRGYTIVRLDPIRYSTGAKQLKPGGTGYLLATKEKLIIVRLWDYIKGFFTFETKRDVDDPELTDRYIRFEKDPYSGLFAIVGSGTTHKYLLYFDGKFPFIHQNWIHMNLGVSFTRYRGQEISSVITDSQGDLKTTRQQYPNQIGTDQWADTAIDFHTLTYNTGELTENEKQLFPDKYTNATYRRDGLSMIGTSFVIGIIATIFQYAFGLPLGILMARKKDTWIDKVGMWYIIFFMSVPSLAYIFIFAAIGTSLFGLPYKFANATVKILAYILPTISLSIPAIGGLMKWMRRYMIDQMNSDYVKFARAEGLSEREIYSTHISKNAMIPIIHGIPGNILGCLVGAIITESVYSVPGVGGLLTKAISGHDNGVIVACTVFYTTLSLISLILGDVLMAKFDPRISFDSKGGR